MVGLMLGLLLAPLVSFANSTLVSKELQTQPSVDHVWKCIKSTADTYIGPGVISFFYTPGAEHVTYVAPTVTALMEDLKWSAELISTTAKPIPIRDIIKKRQHEAVFIFFDNFTAWFPLFHILIGRRILGPETKVIVLAKNVDKVPIQTILIDVWKGLGAINSCLLMVNERNVTVYSMDPFSAYFDIHIANIWADSFENDESLFPDRVSSNLHKFSLKFVEMADPTRSYDTCCEKNIMTIASSVNVPLIMMDKPSNISSVIDALIIRRADVACFGAKFLQPFLINVFEHLPHMLNVVFTLIVRKTDVIPGWKALVIEYSWTGWSCICLTAILTSATLYTNCLVKNIPRSYLQCLFYVFGLHLDNPPNNQVGFPRILGTFFLYIIIVTTAYKSLLITTITNPPHEAQIRSLDEGVAAGYTILPDINMKPWFETFGNEWSAFTTAAKAGKVLYKTSEQEGKELMESKRKLIGLMTAWSESPLISLLRKNPFMGDTMGVLDFLPDFVMTQMISAYMASSHPLSPIFAMKQRHVIEAGLILHWEQENAHVIILKMRHVSQIPFVPSGGDPKPISLDQIVEVFYVYLVCAFVSFSCFIAEKMLFLCNCHCSDPVNVTGRGR